jgi:hypothetical protein
MIAAFAEKLARTPSKSWLEKAVSYASRRARVVF